jgi:hypothetical protein
MPPQGVVSVQDIFPLFGLGQECFGPPPGMEMEPPFPLMPILMKSIVSGFVTSLGFRAFKSSGSAQNAGLAVAAGSFALCAASFLFRQAQMEGAFRGGWR